MACCKLMDELLTHDLNNQETVIGFDDVDGWSCWADHRGGLDKIKFCPWCAAPLPENGRWPAKKGEAGELLYALARHRPWEAEMSLDSTLTCFFCGCKEGAPHVPACLWLRAREYTQKSLKGDLS